MVVGPAGQGWKLQGRPRGGQGAGRPEHSALCWWKARPGAKALT